MKKQFQMPGDNFSDYWNSESELNNAAVILPEDMPSCRHDFYPAEKVSELEIETEFNIRKSGPLQIAIPPYFICIDDEKHFSSICLSYITNFVAHTNKLILKKDRPNTLKLTYVNGNIEIELNSVKFNYNCDYTPWITSVSFTWSGETQIHQLKLDATKQPACAVGLADSFSYHMTVDFTSDIIPAPFTKQMLSKLMKRSKELGVRRINWIYYGGEKSGFWESMRLDEVEQHTWQTFNNLGGDFLSAAVESAHGHGLEIYAIIKPFDMAPHHKDLPFESKLGKKLGKVDVLGGKIYWSDNFVANHPELCIRRRKPAADINKAVSTIIIETRDTANIFPDELKIWVSADNWKYEPYKGLQKTQCRGSKIRIDNLEIKEPYFAISILNNDKRKTVYNTLDRLIKIFDPEEQELTFTYGLEPRQYRKYLPNGTHLSANFDTGGGFSEEGFSFDYIPGIPTSVTNSAQPFNRFFGFDLNADGVIGIARGQNDFVPGCFSPSEPKARKYWRSLVKQAIAKGVDGIDIRGQNHCNVIAWDEYGFNQPIVDEYKKRYGVDIRNEEFDCNLWRKLRGEFFTAFLREVKAETQKHSCKLQVHIEDLYESSPLFTPMGIHWDWQMWLEDKIPDEVTFKAIHFESFKTDMAKKLISICKSKNIPINYCPFLHAVTCQKKELWSDYFEDIRQSGINAFVIYESATLFGVRVDGRLVNYNSKFSELVKNQNKIY